MRSRTNAIDTAASRVQIVGDEIYYPHAAIDGPSTSTPILQGRGLTAEQQRAVIIAITALKLMGLENETNIEADPGLPGGRDGARLLVARAILDGGEGMTTP